MTTIDAAPHGRAGKPAASATPGPLRRFARRLLTNKLALASLAVLVLLILIAVFADLLAPLDPTKQNLIARNEPSSAEHWLGTDDLGRDQLSRLIVGTRITLIAPAVAVALGLVIGVPTGLLAGYLGGWVDQVLSRIADALFSIPSLVLAMAVVAVRGPSTINAMAAVGVLFAPRLFRVVRGSTMSLKRLQFIDAAKTMGSTPLRIVRSHIFNNLSGVLIVQTTVLLGFGVLIEAGLSFLGIGVQPPGASWGVILRRSFDNINAQPIASLWPGLLITILILAFQFLGDGMRDSLGREIRHAK